MELDGTHPLLKVFSEARESRGGEVVVRGGIETGRVFFVGGRIAWASASTVRSNFLTYIVEHSDLTKAQLQEVFDACKQSGQNFGETIIEWGLLSEDVLRKLLLQHLSQCVFDILCWSSVESMFVPDERSYNSSLTFELDEVLQSIIELDTEGWLSRGGAAEEESTAGVTQAEATPFVDKSVVASPFASSFIAPDAAAVPSSHDGQALSRRDLVWWFALNLAVSAALWAVVLWALRH